MSTKAPLQVLLKWPETHDDHEYWYVIRRGSLGDGYNLEGYNDNNTGKTVVPAMFFPISQEMVEKAFKEQGKEWVYEL